MLEIFLPSLARLHKFAGNEIHLFSPGLVTTATVAQLLRLHKASAVCGRGHAEVNPLVRVFHAFACQCLPDISFIHSLSLWPAGSSWLLIILNCSRQLLLLLTCHKAKLPVLPAGLCGLWLIHVHAATAS